MKISPGVLPGEHGVPEILGLAKSLNYPIVRKKGKLQSVEDGVKSNFSIIIIMS